MTPSPLCNIESYPDQEAETETVLVDLSYTSMLTLPPGEMKGLLARFKEFMDPQERTPNVLRKPRPDKPSVKRSVSVDGRGVKSGKEQFGGLWRLRTSFSGSKTQAEDADTQPAIARTGDEESDSQKRKRSSWFHRPLGCSKSIRDRETTEADQRISQTPREGDPPPTQFQAAPSTTTLSRTLSAPTQPTRLSIRNAFPPRRQTPPRARNGDRVRGSHYIPPCADIPAPWTTGEQTIPAVPAPLQVRLENRRQPSRGNLQNHGRNGRPVSQPTLPSGGIPIGPASGTEPFPNSQQPSDLVFDAHRGQNNAWVESPAPEETGTYSSDPRYYTSPFPVQRPVSCPQPGLSDLATATTPQRARPLSPSREASIAAGEAIAQEGEKYVAYCPPPVAVPVPSIENPAQQAHDYVAPNQPLANNTVAELDAGPENTLLTSHTYLEATSPLLIPEASGGELRPAPTPVLGVAADPATLNSVPCNEILTQHGHKHEAVDQRPVDNTVAELDAGPATTLPTSRTYGVVEFAEELRGRRRSSEYSEDSVDGEKGPAAVAGGAAGPASRTSWQQRAAMLEGHVMPETAHDPPADLLKWVERQPSVLQQLTYQRLILSQPSFLEEEQELGPSRRENEGPLVIRPSIMDLEGSRMLEQTESAAEAQRNERPVEWERASSPVPVLYFTTVPPRNALA
ncbi:hypothetical protein LTR27_006687 [Elasticomyces elasticus]|nr:hypothetical protein LTR27_006687 [Elasticomyces elasticus]